MTSDASLDRLPEDAWWGHAFGPGADGVRLHYVRRGRGSPVVLLHGWPGFWYDWRRVLGPLSREADVIVPDLRGFGASDKPAGEPVETYTEERLAADVLALLEDLGIERAVIAGHDVGSAVAQNLASRSPELVAALALFNPTYPGIGDRRYEASAQREFWYQHFHRLPWSHQLVGANRESVELYLSHFYDHWTARKESVRPAEFQAIVDAFAQPEAMRAGFDWYRARAAQRARQTGDLQTSRIPCPTMVRWGEADPVFPAAWSDRLGETFPNLSLKLLPGVGHFVPFEAPEETLKAIQEALTTSS